MMNWLLIIPGLVLFGLFFLGAHKGYHVDWMFPSWLGMMMLAATSGYCIGAAARVVKVLVFKG